MKKIFLVFLLFLALKNICIATPIQTKVNFIDGSLDDALFSANYNNKPLFVFVSSKSCGMCESFSQIFMNDELAAYYNSNFINYWLDADEFNNINFYRLLNPDKQPIVLYYNPINKSLMRYVEGVIETIENKLIVSSSVDIINVGKEIYLEWQVPKEQMYQQLNNYENQFKNGDRDITMLRNYAYLLKALNQNYNVICDTYMYTYLKNGMPRSRDFAQFVLDMSEGINNEACNELLNNITKFKGIFGSQKINSKIKVIVYKSIKFASENGIPDLFDKSIAVAQKANLEDSEKYIFHQKLEYFTQANRWDDFILTVSEYVDKYKITDVAMLNYFSYMFLLHALDAVALLKAEAMTIKSTNIEHECDNFLLLSRIQYKLKKYKVALQSAEQALEYAKNPNKNTDYKKTNAILDFINDIKSNMY